MVALIIIYNHKYDKNIPILEEIYKHKFSNIFHLVPFYTGEKENVIAVYENSYYFEGYIAQAYQILKSKGDFEHYFFIGDDLLLNPEINENNNQSKVEKLDLPFPFIWGYSDILIVPSAGFKTFAHYCGLFAASRLFVEVAIPTAMIMTFPEIQTRAGS